MSHGYHRLELCKNNIRIKHQVHRLVALTFIPNPHNLPMINHIDNVGINNHVSNLEWCDNSHNMKHAFRVTKSLHPRKGKTGELCGSSLCVRATNIKTGEVLDFGSQRIASESMRIAASNIMKVATGEKEAHKGWKFEYTRQQLVNNRPKL